MGHVYFNQSILPVCESLHGEIFGQAIVHRKVDLCQDRPLGFCPDLQDSATNEERYYCLGYITWNSSIKPK